MLSELKIRPRSVSSREHALRMITASGSSSSSIDGHFRGGHPGGVVHLHRHRRAIGAAARPAAATRDALGVALAEKSWSCVSRLIARRPELDSRSVSVLS